MINEYLNQAYPLSEKKWNLCFAISVFVALFMLVFQPFGLSTGQGSVSKALVLCGYGFVTFVTLVFNLFVMPLVLKNDFTNKVWTVKKQILWLFWILFTIGTGNHVYSSFVFGSSKSWHAFMVFECYTSIVGIIPIVVLTILKQNSMLAKNLKSANECNRQLSKEEKQSKTNKMLCLTADNEKDKLDLDLSDFVYIESTANYIQVYFLKDANLKNIFLRSSLKRAEQQLAEHTEIVKCHRAFLVNINKIAEVTGNSQGLKLRIKNLETEIPVSRSFAKSLKEQLSTVQ